MNGWTDEQMARRTDEWMDVQKVWSIGGRIDEWMNGGMDGWRDV